MLNTNIKAQRSLYQFKWWLLYHKIMRIIKIYGHCANLILDIEPNEQGHCANKINTIVPPLLRNR